MDRILVLGLGNRLRGDDGAGPAVIEVLSRMDLPPQVKLIDGGTPGLETVLLLQGYGRAILVDAADMGLVPGTWRRFTPDTAEIKRSETAMNGTLHAAGLSEALALARALDLLPETLVIYGIQPKRLGWSSGLTEPLRAALPVLTDAIAGELNALVA